MTIMRCGMCGSPDLIIATGCGCQPSIDGWLIFCGGPEHHAYVPTPGSLFMIRASVQAEFEAEFAPREDPK